MNDTVFGKIIRGEIPATKVYEDEQCIAFMDIKPVSKGHLLLLPKEQYRWIQDTPDSITSYIFIKAKEIIKAMVHSIPCDLVQIVVVGEEVPHFHIHLIPRMHHDDVGNIHPTVSYANPEEMNLFADKIRSGLEK